MPSPAPPTIERDPYERVDAWTETAFSAPYVTVEAHNAVYEDPAFLDRFRAAIPPGVEQSPRSVFTTALSFSQPPPGDRTTDRLLGVAATYARREFRRSLAEDGLRSVTPAGSQDLRLRGRRTAKAFGYDAAYPLADGAGPASFGVRVWAAIWPTDDAFAMAGGVYPRESVSLPRLDLTVEARPSGDRREVFDAIRDAAEG